MSEINLSDLTSEVTRRDTMPIDAYEVAAVLESLGMTDITARQRYGVDSVFVLAKSMFSTIRGMRTARELFINIPPTPTRASDWLIGLLLIIPSLITVLYIRHVSFFGQLDTAAVLSLCWGLSCGIFAANCCTLGITRRFSFLLGMRNMSAARRFLLITCAISVASLISVGIASSMLMSRMGIQTVLPFTFGFVGMGVIWFLAGILSILHVAHWFPISMAAGLLTTVLIDLAIAYIHPVIVLFGSTYGFAVTIAIMLVVVWRTTKPVAAHAESTKLPSAQYLTAEALPFTVYGIVYAIFILLPHGLALLSAAFTGQTIDVLNSFEAGMTLALLPCILGIGFLEITQRAFWSEMPQRQNQVAGWKIDQFGQWALQFHKKRFLHYALVLTVICAASIAMFEWLRNSGGLEQLLSLTDVNMAAFVFYVSLAAFTALALGSFNGMFFLALDQTTSITAVMFFGCGITLVLGVMFGLLGYINMISVAFLIGAISMLFVSWRAVRSLMRSADYYISAASF